MNKTVSNEPASNPLAAEEFFRTRSDCTIERRAKLSHDAFAREYLFANRPVIITDALDRWRALQRWNPEFFKSQFGDLKFTITDPYSQRLYKATEEPKEYRMADFIDRVVESTDSNPAPYFRNKIFYDLFPSLRQDIEPLPDYIRPNWLADRFLLRGATLNRHSVIEIYIGGRGSRFPVLHQDGDATHAFLMQVYGRKEFILYSPEQEPFLYPSPLQRNLSLLNDIDAPDRVKFPLFMKATPTKFVLEPGELLFVPSLWWHTTRMLTPSITLSINAANKSNWAALVKSRSTMPKNRVILLARRIYLSAAGARRSWRDRNWIKRIQT